MSVEEIILYLSRYKVSFSVLRLDGHIPLIHPADLDIEKYPSLEDFHSANFECREHHRYLCKSFPLLDDKEYYLWLCDCNILLLLDAEMDPPGNETRVKLPEFIPRFLDEPVASSDFEHGVCEDAETGDKE